ncbi:uncharacterized protein LOC134533083 isoform X1 [Bacillus rossius redtenbacheri]|uniref:uncharacterized protein LOC134533083 isoform X1 n=1 Tax=Bacillus rossius redtenbacheri TaxID=93214 RepID=UPI002FDDCA3D
MMEFVIVLIFCVVLVIAVMVIGSGMGKATSSQRQMDIINVVQNLYVLIRKGDLKKCDVTQTTAFLLNIAKSTVLKYYKKDIEEVSTPGKKRKKRPQEGKSLDTVDDFTVNAIRNAIYRMYAEGLNVTVDTILKEIRERQIDYYGGRSSLHKLLKKMGFSWTTVDGRKALIENENIVLQRIDFLRKYKEEKERGTVSKSWQDKSLQSAKRRTVGDGKRFIVVNAGGRTGFVPGAGLLFVSGQKTADYHGEMNGETFLIWFEDMLVHLEEPSVIIMDNASYHSTQVEKTPTTNWTKDALIAWLEKNEIKHENNLLKVELLRIAKQNKPRIRYEVDKLARNYGHEILRLPPYHCHYNAIELVWAQCKHHYNSNVGRAKRFDNDAVAAIWKEALDASTPERWARCVDHVEKLIQADWEREVHIDSGTIPPLIIHLGEDSSSEDSDSEEFEVTTQQVDGDSEVLAVPLDDLPGCSY